MKIIYTTIISLLICQFSYSQVWVEEDTLPVSGGTLLPFTFSIGGKLYIGGGYSNGSAQSTLYEYDPASNTITTKASMPVALEGNYGFVINGKGYIACGANSGGLSNLVYMYDPATDTWTQKNDFPGNARQNQVCFSRNGYGYMFGGFIGGGTVLTEMWQYDTLTDNWTQMASAPGPGRNNPAFLKINNQIYVGLGAASNGPPVYSDFYYFNPDSNTYTPVANIPVGRTCVANFTLNNLGYIGLGNDSVDDYLNDFYTFNPSTDTWTQIGNFGGVGRAHAFSDTAAGTPYVGCGAINNSTDASDIWSYGYPNGIQAIVNTSAIVCYPSPTSGAFYITAPAMIGDKQISIYNDLGQLIYQTTSDQDKTEVTDVLSPGIYVVSVSQTSQREYAKIVVAK